MPTSLLTAIGLVATSSAKLESSLRFLIGKMTGDHDAGWIVFEGQSMDWLISNSIAVLDEYMEGRGQSNDNIASYCRDLRDPIKRATELRVDRNVVIHGEWSRNCFLGVDEDGYGCKPHSDDSLRGGEVCHVIRSNYRKGSKEEAWNISEIEICAAEIEICANKIRANANTWTSPYNADYWNKMPPNH